MAIHRNPRLNTANELIFYLDALNQRSYPGAGSIWYDLSANANHFTLYNSPTFVNGGTTSTYFRFNGTNQFARSSQSINFNSYPSVIFEIGFRTFTTNTSVLIEHTGTAGTTVTGGISLIINSDNTSTVNNVFVSMWQSFGPRLFGFSSKSTTTFNSITDVFVASNDSAGRATYINGDITNYFTSTGAINLTTSTYNGLTFANTLTYIASRNGTANFFAGEITYVRAWGQKISYTEILNAREIATTPRVGPFGNFSGATLLNALPAGGGGAAPADPQTLTSSQAFSYTGASQTFTVPAGIWWIRVTANGASGGVGSGAITSGAGGYIRGWVATTPGTVLTVIVGQGGRGKGALAISRYGGGGGGWSGVTDNTNAHLISAGGGGGSQLNTPYVFSGTATLAGGHTLVYSTTAAAGGAAGVGSPSSAVTNVILNGAAGTSTGGGNGGTTWTGSAPILDAGGGGGGGGFGTTAGLGGPGNNGSNSGDNTQGEGGAGGFGGGGGGGGGGFGGANQRTNPGGGGGGGYIGGAGGYNNTTAEHRHGQGGWNFLKDQTNPRGGSVTPLVTTTSGGGASGVSGAGTNGNNGSVTIEW